MKSTAAEIDQKLKEDFRHYIREYVTDAQATDPIMAVLFRTFAAQIHAIYSETDRMRLSILDELIEGLGFARRFAHPAQTVVSFQCDENVNLAGGTELRCHGEETRGLTFVTDYGISVSAARVAFALVYQANQLRLVTDMDLPTETLHAGPAYDSVPARLGPYPAVFIAVENLGPTHLSNHGIYFQLDPDAVGLRNVLTNEVWCLGSDNGTFGGRGLLRPHPLNAGQRTLDWLITAAEDPAIEVTDGTLGLPHGHWQGRCFRFPDVPDSRRWACQIPRGLDAPIRRIFENWTALASEPRAWLRIQLPEQIEPLHTALRGVYLNCQSASNVECLNQTVRFVSDGPVVPISREGGTGSFLVAPLSITGESGRDYLPEFEPTMEAARGRYRINQGNLSFVPGRSFNGSLDTYVNVRSWMTSGRSGNELGTGTLQRLSGRPASPTRLYCTNITQGAGGTDGEDFLNAKARFTESLLSRERLTTRSDLENACRAFDRRIVAFDVRSTLARRPNGVRRLHRITLQCDRSAFTDPSEEGRILASDLEVYLRERSPFDVDLTVDLGWLDTVA